MNCRRIEPQLFDLVEGLLPEREAAAAAAHLEGCSSCRRRRDSFLALRAGLRGLQELQPPPHLARRAILRWAAEEAAGLRSANHERRGRALRGTRAGRLTAGVSFAVAAVALALISVALMQWNRAAPIRRPAQIVQRTDPAMPEPERNGAAKDRLAWSSGPRNGVISRAGDGKNGRFRDAVGTASQSSPSFAPSLTSRLRDEKPERALSLAPRHDDLIYLNGPDPVSDVRPWAPVPRDEWAAFAAKLRREVRVKDDFVQIPFPRIAGASEAAIVAAVEQYKHEAVIVDPRLFHEVTLAQKATALSDLCDHLRSDTGIQLTAGRSVADEKVTIFCEKLPLREVMRQLSRPFGYTWLRSKKEGGAYRYELVQDLKSQLLEEALRNRDRDAALIAVDQEMGRYRPFLNLSPDEALARAKTAGEGDKELLEKLGGAGWGPIQMYFRLSPQEQAALRAGQKLTFKQEPGTGEAPLPPDIARGVLQSRRDLRMMRESSGAGDEGSSDVRIRQARADEPDGLAPSVVPEARAFITLKLDQTELGRFDFSGASEVSVRGWANGNDTGPYAVGQSPSTLQPENGAVNAALGRDPKLLGKVTVSDFGFGTADLGLPAQSKPTGVRPAVPNQSKIQTPHPEGTRHPKSKITTADVLEALHRATGMPIVSDFYTHLYAADSVTVKDQPLFEALNHLADAMRLRWKKQDGWLQFRSASFYNDRPKEVPNRLLSRWAAARQEHGQLTLDDLIEIAGLSDTQLDAHDMGEGAKELWGLGEWGLASNRALRPHLRWMAGFTPAERQKVQRPPGLRFTELTLPQQQQFMALALGDSSNAIDSLQELATAAVQIDEELPGQFEWQAPEKPGGGAPEPLAPVRAATRAAALAAARRLDPQADLSQIQPTQTAINLLYYWGTAEAGGVYRIRTTDPGGTSVERNSHHRPR